MTNGIIGPLIGVGVGVLVYKKVLEPELRRQKMIGPYKPPKPFKRPKGF